MHHLTLSHLWPRLNRWDLFLQWDLPYRLLRLHRWDRRPRLILLHRWHRLHPHFPWPLRLLPPSGR
jgi:hypothetical protein